MKRTIFMILARLYVTVSANAAVSVDGLLASKINALPLGLTPVVITFNQKPTTADFNMLRSLGITGGRYLNQLPIVLTSINRAPVQRTQDKAEHQIALREPDVQASRS